MQQSSHPGRDRYQAITIDPEALADARYMAYYMDEDYEGLHISDVVHPLPFTSLQYSHGGSELKADRKNRVEEMKLGKHILTLNSQQRLTEALRLLVAPSLAPFFI